MHNIQEKYDTEKIVPKIPQKAILSLHFVSGESVGC